MSGQEFVNEYAQKVKAELKAQQPPKKPNNMCWLPSARGAS